MAQGVGAQASVGSDGRHGRDSRSPQSTTVKNSGGFNVSLTKSDESGSMSDGSESTGKGNERR
jgi:hypothetical protein